MRTPFSPNSPVQKAHDPYLLRFSRSLPAFIQAFRFGPYENKFSLQSLAQLENA